jgi:hypothetical protein
MISVDPRFITPVLITALVIWGLYRRARRFIGRQALQPGQLRTRVVIFAVVGGLFIVTSAHDTKTLEALLAGTCAGAALGWLGLKYTRFEATSEGRFYTPHAYIGLIVTALLVGRVLYRMMIMYSGARGLTPVAAGAAGSNPFAAGPYGGPGALAYQSPYGSLRTPLTFAIFGALVGYYISYYLGVLSKSRRLATPEQTTGAQ